MGKSGQRKATTTFAVLACLLQAASIASPGWMVYIKGNIEEHHSLFYRRICKTLMDESKCKVKSFHDLHFDHRDKLIKAQVSREKIASVDLEYNNLICKQVLIFTATFLAMVMVVSQIIQSVKKKTYTRLLVLSAATAATSAGIVIAVVFKDIVYVYYQIEVLKLDGHRDHTYVGFPFCLGMLLGSAMFLFFSIVSIAAQLHTPKLRIKVKKPPPPTTSFDDDVPSTQVPPVTSLKEVSKPKYDMGNDNPVFSEKL